MEQEPASAGKAVIEHYRRSVLAAHDFRSVSPWGSKERRAEIVSARAEAGDIFILRGDWIGEFLDELAAFPHGSHDDQVDALSAGYGYLAGKQDLPIMALTSITRPSPWHIPSVTDAWPSP